MFKIFWLSSQANAHVKWFTQSTDRTPISISELNHPAFWFLLVLSVVTLGLFAVADRYLEKWAPYKKLENDLANYSDRASVILRIFTGAALLLSWQADSMIAPELKTSAGPGWFQFFLALGLLTKRTSPFSGLGMIVLYIYAITQHGFFHMLDYLVYAAIGYYLFVERFPSKKIAQTKIPALYIGLGFSLCWAALEKVFFPEWGLDVLAQKPMLTMGLPHDFFLLSCAFVELCLGYLLIIGILQRPLALVITLVFFTTTAFFGKTEVIGHTILHGALLVFVVVGPGNYYPAPIEFHRRLSLRAAFAAVNFLVVVGILGFAYSQLAHH